MLSQDVGSQWNLRGLLKSTATPFSAVHYGQGAVIFRQGDTCDHVMYIDKGRVWLAVMTRSGREAISGLLEAGAFLGEEALAGETVRRQTATAMVPVEVLVVAKAHMRRLLYTQPEAADHLIAHSITRQAYLTRELTAQILMSAKPRLAHTLLTLAHCSHRTPRGVLPHVSQEVLAEMVGTTRPRVSVFMCQFKAHGFIEMIGGERYVNASRLHGVLDGVSATSDNTSSDVRAA